MGRSRALGRRGGRLSVLLFLFLSFLDELDQRDQREVHESGSKSQTQPTAIADERSGFTEQPFSFLSAESPKRWQSRGGTARKTKEERDGAAWMTNRRESPFGLFATAWRHAPDARQTDDPFPGAGTAAPR
ncbi:hypothetical protein EDB83DRAFT_2398121 [Lactarius deliciosus]|nr:hypothetical protein EDB83DRAFT_2425376 [Lactarius deliciosus]KAH9051139.1 hypothetical protein EDB83DRAFT_2398121 [Lactarius deliciosus]